MTESKESIRVGAPPIGPPVFLDPPRPKKRRRRLRWEVPITVAVVGVILALGASVVGFLMSRTTPPGSAPSASGPGTSRGPVAMTERQACATVVPLATDGATELTAVLKNPNRDTTALAAIAAELRAVEPAVPTTIRQDLVVVDQVLQGVADAHGDPGRIAAAIGNSSTWSDAGLRIAAHCRQYAGP